MKESFLSYFESKTNNELANLSNKEKESLKLLLWSQFLEIFSSSSTLGAFMNSLQEKAGKAIGKLHTIAEEDSTSLDEVLDDATKSFNEFFSLPNADDIFGKTYDEKFAASIQEVKQYKLEHPEEDISELAVLNQILNGEQNSPQSSQEIYKNIETQSKEIADSLAGKKELGTQLVDTIEKLPLGMGDSVKEFMKGLVKKWPILGFLVGLIMGPDFL